MRRSETFFAVASNASSTAVSTGRSGALLHSLSDGTPLLRLHQQLQPLVFTAAALHSWPAADLERFGTNGFSEPICDCR